MTIINDSYNNSTCLYIHGFVLLCYYIYIFILLLYYTTTKGLKIQAFLTLQKRLQKIKIKIKTLNYFIISESYQITKHPK